MKEYQSLSSYHIGL